MQCRLCLMTALSSYLVHSGWLALGAVYALVIFLHMGSHHGSNWLAGSLSCMVEAVCFKGWCIHLVTCVRPSSTPKPFANLGLLWRLLEIHCSQSALNPPIYGDKSTQASSTSFTIQLFFMYFYKVLLRADLLGGERLCLPRHRRSLLGLAQAGLPLFGSGGLGPAAWATQRGRW